MSEEKNRFSVLKENTFKKKSIRNNFKKDEKSSSNSYQPKSNNYQPKSNNYQAKSNSYQPKSNSYQPKSNNRNKFRRTKRQYNNNQEVKPVIGKFRQVGVGEVSFIPQVKKSKQEKKKQEKKLVPFKKEEESPMDHDDIALTLAFAEKYQYITESEEEGEEGEEGEEEED